MAHGFLQVYRPNGNLEDAIHAVQKLPFLNGKMGFMNVTAEMDKVGRLVVPKKIRESLHIGAGARFEVIEQDDGIFLRPLQSLPTLIRRSGALVMSSGSPSNYDILQMVEADRQSRMQQISGELDGYPEAHKVGP